MVCDAFSLPGATGGRWLLEAVRRFSQQLLRGQAWRLFCVTGSVRSRYVSQQSVSPPVSRPRPKLATRSRLSPKGRLLFVIMRKHKRTEASWKKKLLFILILWSNTHEWYKVSTRAKGMQKKRRLYILQIFLIKAEKKKHGIKLRQQNFCVWAF